VNACPHCGVNLPEVVDAFCPECRQPLGEPTVYPEKTGEDKTAGGLAREPVGEDEKGNDRGRGHRFYLGSRPVRRLRRRSDKYRGIRLCRRSYRRIAWGIPGVTLDAWRNAPKTVAAAFAQPAATLMRKLSHEFD
jgi:hypothetical protein